MSEAFNIFDELGMANKSNDSLFRDGTDAEEALEESSDFGTPEELEDEDEIVDGEESFEDDDEGDEDDEQEAETSGLAEMLKAMQEELKGLRAQLAEQKSGGEKKEEAALIEFVDEALFESAVSSKDGLNKLLNTVHQAGHASAMQLLPALVREEAQKIYEERALIESFYRSNPDLDKVRPVVMTVAKEVAAEFPNEKNTKKLFLEIAKRSRARIGGGSGNKVASTKHKNPGSVSSGAGRPGNGRPGGKKKLSISDEINIMKRL
jgi:hypothetical protein